MKTKTELTFRENFLRAARRQNPQWVPMDFGLTPGTMLKFRQHADADADPCEYFRFDGRWLGPNPTRRPIPDWRALYYADGILPAEATIDPDWGCGYLYDIATDDRFQFYPLRAAETVADIDAFPWPDEGAAYRYEGCAEKVAQVQKDGYAVHFSGCIIFESIWNLCGFERLLIGMAEGDAMTRRLFDRMYNTVVHVMAEAARTGADVVTMGGDVATQRGPMFNRDMWREYVRPLMADGIRAAKQVNPNVLIDYHSCGNISTFMEDFIEVGVDILNPVQAECMDIFELKRLYGKHITFHGGIGVQSVLPHGTVQEVKDMVRKTIDIMADGGGYICCPSHCISRDVPWENIMALVDTAREYGHP